MAAVALSSSCSNDLVSQDSAEWAASLPSDVMFLILDNLFESTDLVRFAAVCKRWNSVANDYYKHSASRILLPMLMIPEEESIEEPKEGALLYSVSEERVYSSFRFQIPRPRSSYHYSEKVKSFHYGAGHGWLARAVRNPSDEFSSRPKPQRLLRITLLNPFRSQETSFIALPQFPLRFHDYNTSFYKLKVVLSADPTLNPDNYVVILLCTLSNSISRSKLGFLTRGRESWTWVGDYGRLTDAIFYKGRGYAVEPQRGYDNQSEVDVITLDLIGTSDSPLRAGFVFPRQHDEVQAGPAYLVESTRGDLLCVQRYFKREICTPVLSLRRRLWRTERFKVYKLILNDEDGSAASLVEVNSIGDDAVFLGSNSQSVSVLASKHPGCRPNCIYYTNDPIEDRWEFETLNTVKSDMGIFNMEQETITQLCPRNFGAEQVSILLGHTGTRSYLVNDKPIWITPTFGGLY